MLGNPNKTGYSPQTALSQKLKAMGISSVDQLQGTTKRIFDTVVTTATGLEYQFFNQNRALPDTNFQQRFGVGEAMILQELSVQYNGGTGYSNDKQPGLDVGPTVATDGYYTVRIGNTNVVENVPLAGSSVQYLQSNQPSFNGNYYKFVFNSLLVLPPDTDFTVILNINAPFFDGLQAHKIRVTLTGTAVELNAKF